MSWRISKLPYAVLIDERGIVRGKGLVNSREQIESLLTARDLGLVSVQAYMDRIKNLIDSGGKILGIQAYTLARPTFAPGLDSLKLSALTKVELEALGEEIRKNTGLAVECYA